MSEYKGKHVRPPGIIESYGAARMSMARCEYGASVATPCESGLCPRHNPDGYADAMARHAAGYDGSPTGFGATI